MRKIFQSSVLLVGLLGFPPTALAQVTIKPEDAAKFIGQQKTVCGKVSSTFFAAKSKGQPTFINLDMWVPNQVRILGSDRSKFEKPPEILYSGKEICVTGMIQSYQGRPEIIVKEPGQIRAR